MSEMAGIDAFDSVMERLLDEREQRIRQHQDREKDRHELSVAQQRIRELERDVSTARDEATRWKALVPPEALAKAEKDNEIPF